MPRRPRSRSVVLSFVLAGWCGLAVAPSHSLAAPDDGGASSVAPLSVDPVTDPPGYWNLVLLDVIRGERGDAAGPTRISRAAAMMHGAIHDAYNSISPKYEPAVTLVGATLPASFAAAAGYAAYGTLRSAFPTTSVDLDAALQRARAGAVEPSWSNGRSVGERVGTAMIAARANDGADDRTPYVPGSEPGDWRETGSGPALTPNWSRVRPFCISSGAQFRPPPPAGIGDKPMLLASPQYAAQFDDVKSFGAVNSTSRTEEQRRIAFFWANDVDGTYKPPGQLLVHAQAAAKARNFNDPLELAGMYALVAIAMADAAIVAWDSKYATDIDLWRPETAIKRAVEDGNTATMADPNWQPLSVSPQGVRFSPPFPAYISGHATFAAAWAEVMRRFFGDNSTFVATTDDPSVPGMTRTITRFVDAARENGRSRVYLGVHFQWDADVGFTVGQATAGYVWDNCLNYL